MDTNDNNNRDGVESEQVSELVEKKTETSSLLTAMVVFIAVSLAIVVHSAYSIYDMVTDDSIPLTVCPRSYDLDAPVLLKTINKTNSLVVQDRWIRGFVRRYLTKLYPRTAGDVSSFYEYVKDHSDGSLYYKYEGYLANSKEIESLISSGYSYKFYPKSMDQILIRTEEGSTTSWRVDVDGYLLKSVSKLVDRSTPTIKLKIKAVNPTIKNPEGLVVTSLDVETIADYVSGRKEKE